MSFERVRTMSSLCQNSVDDAVLSHPGRDARVTQFCLDDRALGNDVALNVVGVRRVVLHGDYLGALGPAAGWVENICHLRAHYAGLGVVTAGPVQLDRPFPYHGELRFRSHFEGPLLSERAVAAAGAFAR